METPCTSCVHYVETQIAQFSFEATCRQDAPTNVLLSKWGCWMYERKKRKTPVCRCGGQMSDVLFHNGRPYRHCYSCNFDFFEEDLT